MAVAKDQFAIPLGLIEPDIPIGVRLTSQSVALGRKLFFDTGLSASGKTSCATCHSPAHGFAEARAVSVSDNGQSQARNAPSVINAGYLESVGWDGGFDSLEEQIIAPFQPDGDMGIEFAEAVERVANSSQYVGLFLEAFQSRPSGALVRRALANYQRSLVSGGTRFDRFLFGSEVNALTPEERHGYEVFVDRANCINCHDIFHPSVNPLGGRIALFTDHRFHNLGVGADQGWLDDTGRYRVTGMSDDWGAFKTPTLRNVALTAPYMHDGSLATLEEVVAFYDRGGLPNRNLSPTLRPLYLSAGEQRALVAFLKALTDSEFVVSRIPGVDVH